MDSSTKSHDSSINKKEHSDHNNKNSNQQHGRPQTNKNLGATTTANTTRTTTTTAATVSTRRYLMAMWMLSLMISLSIIRSSLTATGTAATTTTLAEEHSHQPTILSKPQPNTTTTIMSETPTSLETTTTSPNPVNETAANTMSKTHSLTTAAIKLDDFTFAASSSPHLLLSVPFYVYEELYWLDKETSNATFGNLPVQEFAHAKHSNDYWFAEAATKHPMRTQDPNQAQLFVLPLLLNIYDQRAFQKTKDFCVNVKNDNNNKDDTSTQRRRLCNLELMQYVTTYLEHQEWFVKYPEKHIVTTSHFAYTKKWWKSASKPKQLSWQLESMNAICYEARKCNAANRFHFPSYLVGNGCWKNDDSSNPTTTTKKTHDVAMIASLTTKHEPNQAKFQDRRNICNWLQPNGDNSTWSMVHNSTPAQTSATTTRNDTINVSTCGRGSQCPALRDSKLGFHAQGDTFGSQRLMDTILSGTVPIFTRRPQYACQPSWVDWKYLSFEIDLEAITTRQDFRRAVLDILQNPELLQEKISAIQHNRPLFDWKHTLYPFDTYMYMLQAQIYPETRIPKSKHVMWPALILPPPPLGNKSLGNPTMAQTDPTKH